MGEALTIEVRHQQGCVIVSVAGEIDISTVTPLHERLFEMAASGAPLVVDLEQVSFIDSVGLATLMGAAKRAAAHGGSLQVACMLPKIRQLVRLAGLDSQIPLAHTLDEALTFRAATSTDPPSSPAQLCLPSLAAHARPACDDGEELARGLAHVNRQRWSQGASHARSVSEGPTAGPGGAGQFGQDGGGGVEVEAGVGDALPVGQGGRGSGVLPPGAQEAFQHHPGQAGLAGGGRRTAGAGRPARPGR